MALSATLAMQINASMLDQAIAVVAPLLTAELGIRPERVGVLSTCSASGVVFFLLFGAPFIQRFGAVRMLQAGALLAAVGAALATSGWWPLVLGAALLIGLGYGPSPPAGSRILAATAPPRHRTLIFSIKQAGAPIGGAIAALLLAPTAAAFGWRAALFLGAAIAVLAAICVHPLRRRLDAGTAGGPQRLRDVVSLGSLLAPIGSILEDKRLLSISGLAFSFALVQSCLLSFSVTYLSTSRGLGLAEAGAAYAVLQVSGACARIALGWLADRTGTPSINLFVQALIAACLVAGYGQLPTGSPFWLVACMMFSLGFCAVSWNGIIMAEVARLCPPDRIAEATSGSALVAFLGYLIGPLAFSLLVSWSGGYGWPFAIFAVQLLATALAGLRLHARQRTGIGPGAPVDADTHAAGGKISVRSNERRSSR